MLKLKLLIIAAFAVFASSAFLFSSNYTQAQTKENAAKRDEILQKVAYYKTWQQVQKPEKKSEDVITPDVLTISDSAVGG